MVQMTMVSEGVKSCQGLLELAKSVGVEMPIAQEVGHVLYDGKSAQQAVIDLRSPRDVHYLDRQRLADA